MNAPKDFFISYNKADRQWAEWIAWTLEEAGYSVVIQAWDFRPGGNFVLGMQRAATEAQKTIAVLSEDYLKAAFTQPEWAVAFAQDPQGSERTLIPVRVQRCSPPGLLAPIIWIDLVDLAEDKAQDVLLQGLQARGKPLQKPLFPSGDRVTTQNVAFPGQAGKPWTVPYDRNPHFIGRNAVLEQLRTNLVQGSTTALTQPQAISGLGGVGKTQTAVEYAFRHRDGYDAVFWVRGETELALSRGFVEIARVLGLPLANAQNEAEAVAETLAWLNQNNNWLLIFDNADEPERLRPFLPRNEVGHVLVTSRADDLQDLGITRPVPLDVLAPDEAQAFLWERVGREATADVAEQTAVQELAEALGYLPLALEQAAAYILAKKARFQDYLASYRKLKLERLESAKPKLGNYPESVATTWLLNFQQVRQESEAAAEVLKLSAFLAPDAIPFELLVLGRDKLGEVLGQALAGVEEDPLALNELLTPLRRYSLIQVNRESQTYSIHRLVQEVIRAEMEPAQRSAWLEQAILAMTQAFPSPEFKNWSFCERLLPHAIVLADLEATNACQQEETGRLFNQAGVYSYERGQYAAAESFYLRSLSINEQQLGKDHPNVAASLNNLAGLYHAQGRYSEAEPLLVRSLSIQEQQLGKDHPNVATSLNNLAGLYREQGRYNDAEPLLGRSLSIREQQLGPDHPAVATSLNNLALHYDSQGHYSEAELLYVRSLSIRERQLGSDHPAVAESLNNLAGLCDAQGRFSEAEPLYVRSLSIREQQLGSGHPKVAEILNNLASHYDAQGRYSEAEPLLVRSLSIQEQHLGKDHPNVATSLNNLAGLYREQGRYSEAEPLLVRSLSIRKRQLGPNHPDVAQSLNNLAGLYELQSRYSEAESLFVRSLSIWKQQLGPDHPDVAQSLNNLAVLYYYQNRYSEAEPLFVEGLRILMQLSEQSGFEHPGLQTGVENFLRFIAQVLQAGQQSILSNHPLTQAAIAQLQNAQASG